MMNNRIYDLDREICILEWDLKSIKNNEIRAWKTNKLQNYKYERDTLLKAIAK